MYINVKRKITKKKNKQKSLSVVSVDRRGRNKQNSHMSLTLKVHWVIILYSKRKFLDKHDNKMQKKKTKKNNYTLLSNYKKKCINRKLQKNE